MGGMRQVPVEIDESEGPDFIPRTHQDRMRLVALRNDAGLNVVVQLRSANGASPNKLFTRSLGSKMYASREIDPVAKLPRPMADECVPLAAFNTANGGIVHGVY